MRKQGSCLEKEIMQGTMPGACRPEWTTSRHGQDSPWKSQSDCKDKDKWRKHDHVVANPRIEDD